MVDYSKFDNLADSDDESPSGPAPSSGGGYSEEERARLMAEAQAAAAAAPTSDPRSEIEKLKAERRAKAAARKAEEEASGVSSSSAPEPVTADVVEETAEEIGPMGMLTKHEKSAENIAVEAKAVLEALSAGPAGDALDALGKRVVALGAALGKLQNGMEEISIGSLDDDQRAVAKKIRVGINSRIEEELMPACSKCRVALNKAKA